MRTHPQDRPRFSPEAILGARQVPLVVTGQDLYATMAAYTPPASPAPPTANGFYSYHQGDFFTPGAPGWVLDQRYETPLMCMWGNGTLLRPNRGIPPYGTRADHRPPDPFQAPFLPHVATPWGTALLNSPGPGVWQQSLQANTDGSFQAIGTTFGPPPELAQVPSSFASDY